MVDLTHSVTKTIVICSDGTGNHYSGTPSNVFRLYNFIVKGGPQIACYDPGVGTLPLPEGRTAVGRRIRHVKELCFGDGVIPNVVELYTYLTQHYEQGDRIFLFGFSRGAFTVRALAGMLHVCGLLRRDDIHLVPYAAGLYQTSEDRIKIARRKRRLPRKFTREETKDHASFDAEACDFKERLSRPCRVAFIGIWDTVKAYGWLLPRSFPALRHNPSVEIVRHALSLDEQRALFKVTGWGDRHGDVKEVWFAGDHSDVGGGHRRGNSALADATLTWMLGEATKAGLRLEPDKCADINKITANSAQAISARRNDLWWQGGYWLLDNLLRMELNNAVYPPRRTPKLFLPDGKRKPADHAEEAALLFHWTVRERSDRGDPAYRLPTILARSKRRSGPAPPTKYESDLPITWHEHNVDGETKGSTS